MFEKFQTPAAAAQAPDTNATPGLLKGLTNFPPMATTNTAATNLSALPSNAPLAVPPK